MSKRKGAGRRRTGNGGKLALGIVSCIQLALALALAVQRRQAVSRALREDGKVRVLLEQEETEEREA